MAATGSILCRRCIACGAKLEVAESVEADIGSVCRVELDPRQGDIRDLTLDEPAALIYCPCRALLYLPGWADRRRTFPATSWRPVARLAPAAVDTEEVSLRRAFRGLAADPRPSDDSFTVRRSYWRCRSVQGPGAVARVVEP